MKSNKESKHKYIRHQVSVLLPPLHGASARLHRPASRKRRTLGRDTRSRGDGRRRALRLRPPQSARVAEALHPRRARSPPAQKGVSNDGGGEKGERTRGNRSGRSSHNCDLDSTKPSSWPSRPSDGHRVRAARNRFAACAEERGGAPSHPEASC